MGTMKILLLVVLVTAGCAQPQRSAKSGDAVSDFHLRDAKTGACLSARQVVTSGQWIVYKVAERECQS